ncbi:MAG: hypothetical protein ACOYIF_11810 [Acetivibrionales bacterium]
MRDQKKAEALATERMQLLAHFWKRVWIKQKPSKSRKINTVSFLTV